MDNTGANIFTVGGTVQAGSGLYIARKVDEELLQLCRDHVFAYVLTARQMGKSSLMIRTAQRLADEGTRSAIIDLSQLGVQITDEAWYFGLIMTINRRLKLKTDVFAWWKAHAQLGFTQRMTQFFQEVLLEEIAAPVVIFIDEIDSTLSLPFTDDFFAATRYVYNARATVPAFKRLSFVLIGVATPSDLISDPRRTPFNIGQQVDLAYFTVEEAMPLADGFALPQDDAKEVLRWVIKWTGGHPYLTQRICQVIAAQQQGGFTEADVDRVVAGLFLGERSENDSNLRFVNDMLTRRAADPFAVLTTYQQIHQGRRVPDDKQSATVTHLKLSGIVARRNGQLAINNLIYTTVFDRAWLKKQWPEHWLRRVPPAVLGLIAAVFVAVVLLSLFVFQTQRTEQAQRQSAQQALANTQLSAQVQRSDLLNIALSNQARVSDSLRMGAETINAQLSNQVRISDSLTQVVNRQLSDEVELVDTLLAIMEKVDTQRGELSRQVQLSDSLRTVAVAQLGETQAARLETITIALASKALRQLRLGDAELGALLARQAYVYSQAGEGEFLDPIYDALLQTLNGLGTDGSMPAGGPEVLADFEAPVRSVVYSPDGRWMASASADGTVHLWSNKGSASTMKRLDGHRARVRSLAFSPDGRQLVSGSDDHTVRLWQNLDEEKPDGETLVLHQGGVWAVAFAPDGARLASAGADHTVVIRGLGAEADSVGLDVGAGVRIRTLAFSPDGAVLAFGGEDGTVRLWRWKEPGSQPLAWNAGQGILHTLAFSPDGGLLASGGDSLLVRMWRMNRPDLLPDLTRTLRGHEGPVHAVAFSPDGTTFASGSADHSVQVWNVERLDINPILLQDHAAWVWSLAFSPDGTRLASAGADRTVRLWNIKPDRLAAQICTAVNGREILPDEWDQFVGGDFPYERDYQPCSQRAADQDRTPNGQ